MQAEQTVIEEIQKRQLDKMKTWNRFWKETQMKE